VHNKNIPFETFEQIKSDNIIVNSNPCSLRIKSLVWWWWWWRRRRRWWWTIRV